MWALENKTQAKSKTLKLINNKASASAETNCAKRDFLTLRKIMVFTRTDILTTASELKTQCFNYYWSIDLAASMHN